MNITISTDVQRQTKVGDIFLNIFAEEPWLQSFKMTLEGEAQLSNTNSTYFDISGCVYDVVCVPGVTPPENYFDDDFDNPEQMYCRMLDTQFEVITYIRIYKTMFDEGVSTIVTIEVDRAKVADLIAAGELDGLKAFQQLFPANPLVKPAH